MSVLKFEKKNKPNVADNPLPDYVEGKVNAIDEGKAGQVFEAG